MKDFYQRPAETREVLATVGAGMIIASIIILACVIVALW